MNETLAVVNGTDITKYIIKTTYDINSEPVYQSWEDGNFREHRIYVRDRVKGSFDVIFFGDDNSAYQNFLSLLSAATSNRMLTIGLYVLNESSFQAFQVYYRIKSQQHAETTDGRMVNKMTIELEEY